MATRYKIRTEADISDAKLVVLNNTSGTNSGNQSWGGIPGTLSAQTDLQTALDLKAPLISPTFTTNITTPLIIGGTAVGSKITYKSTTGIGTTTGIAHQFVGGTDGATVGMTILNSGNVGIGTTNPSYLLDASKNGGSGTIIGNFADTANNSRISFRPYDLSIEAFKQGNYGTTFSFNNGGFAVTDTGNTGNTLFKYDAVGLHANRITSSGVAGATYNSLYINSNLFGISTTNPAINFTTYNDSGSTDQLAKLQIFNGDTGKILLNPSGGNVGIGTTGPTAKLMIAAGSASANTAPLKFTSGTLNTTAEAGAVEFLTDKFYGTVTTSALRKMFVTANSGRATAQTAANASVATYTLGATDASFEVSANVLVTTSSAEAFTVTVDYTDEGNTARTATLNFQLLAGTIGTAINFANGGVPYEGIPIHLRVKASTVITVKTVGTFTGATYNVEGIIRQIN